MQCKKILVVGGRLLDPRDSYNNENKELVNSLTIGKWQIEADLDKRVIRIKGPNRAIYPLMEGAIFLCKDKNENNVEVYFTKFYDTKILEFLKKYGIDDVIVEDPNHSFDFRGNTIVCSHCVSKASFVILSTKHKTILYTEESVDKVQALLKKYKEKLKITNTVVELHKK